MHSGSDRVAASLGHPRVIRAVREDAEALRDLDYRLSHDVSFRDDLKVSLLAGEPTQIIGAVRELRRIRPQFEAEMIDLLADPTVQESIAFKVREIKVNELIGLLRWAYRVMPALGDRIEREVVGDVRRRMARQLLGYPDYAKGARRWARVSPVLEDLLRDAVRLCGEDTSLRWMLGRPLGRASYRRRVFERDPRSALSDLSAAFAFIDVDHSARRRQIAADSLLRTVRDLENLNEVVDRSLELNLQELVSILQVSARQAPEVHAAFRTRLSRPRVLESLIDQNLDGDPSILCGLLTSLRTTDPRIYAQATEILASPERASIVGAQILTVNPAHWVGLLRHPGIARPALGSVDQSEWADFWSLLPPEFPQWSRGVQWLLRSQAFASLERAPAEYVLLGTGPEQWSHGAVSLRDLANAIYCRGPLGDRLVLRFLHRIGYRDLIDEQHRVASLWEIAVFVHAIHLEQPMAILRSMVTPDLVKRVQMVADFDWVTRSAEELAGYAALVGALASAGIDMRLSTQSFSAVDLQRVIATSEGRPEGQALIEAGFLRLALI